jgi:hypothetical protein
MLGMGLSWLLMQGAAATSLSLTCPERYPDRDSTVIISQQTGLGWYISFR